MYTHPCMHLKFSLPIHTQIHIHTTQNCTHRTHTYTHTHTNTQTHTDRHTSVLCFPSCWLAGLPTSICMPIVSWVCILQPLLLCVPATATSSSSSSPLFPQFLCWLRARLLLFLPHCHSKMTHRQRISKHCNCFNCLATGAQGHVSLPVLFPSFSSVGIIGFSSNYLVHNLTQQCFQGAQTHPQC